MIVVVLEKFVWFCLFHFGLHKNVASIVVVVLVIIAAILLLSRVFFCGSRQNVKKTHKHMYVCKIVCTFIHNKDG